MANRHRRSHEIALEFTFDRLHATKLEQVFAILVPNRERRIDESTGLKGLAGAFEQKLTVSVQNL